MEEKVFVKYLKSGQFLRLSFFASESKDIALKIINKFNQEHLFDKPIYLNELTCDFM